MASEAAFAPAFTIPFISLTTGGIAKLNHLVLDIAKKKWNKLTLRQQQWMLYRENMRHMLGYCETISSIFLLMVLIFSWILISRVRHEKTAKLMLVVDVGDGMCWWQLWDLADRLKKSTNLMKEITNIMFLSPTCQNDHNVTNITVGEKSRTIYRPTLVWTRQRSWYRLRLRSLWLSKRFSGKFSSAFSKSDQPKFP